MADVDEKALEIAAKRVCMESVGGDNDLSNHSRIALLWSVHADRYRNQAHAAIAAYLAALPPEDAQGLRERVRVLEGALAWYADRQNHKSTRERYVDRFSGNLRLGRLKLSKVHNDKGARARAALTEPGT